MNHTVDRPFYFYDVHIYLCRYASKSTKKSASCSFCRYLSFLLAEYTTEIRLFDENNKQALSKTFNDPTSYANVANLFSRDYVS